MITDPHEIAAADSRAAAIQSDILGHLWRGKTLEKWTQRREIFFQSLETRAKESTDFVESAANSLDQLDIIEKSIDAALAKKSAAQAAEIPDRDTLINWHAFLASAARVLWLAHHTPEDWLPLRADPDAWLQQIEDWADSNIDPPEIREAVRLAHRLRTEHRQFITLPRPEKRKGPTSGN